MRRLMIPLAALLLLSACASKRFYATKYHEAYDRFGRQIEFAAEMKKQAMYSLGQAYAQGLISDEQKSDVLAAGRLADIALETARDTLASYLEGRSSRAAVIAALTAVNQHLYEILSVIDNVAVGHAGGEIL